MDLKLPATVVGQVDVARLIRELNGLEDFFTAAKVRESGSPMTPPRLTRVLESLTRENKVNLLEAKERQALTTALDKLLKNAPLLHISFASEPPPRFLSQILEWLRANVHPQTLLQVGLQPTIAAGCVLRTPNKIIDMSLRSYLNLQEPYLVKLISGAAHGN